MRTIIYIITLFLSFNSFSQSTFEYEFDENITLNIPEESEEGDLEGNPVVKGVIGSDIFVFTKTHKASSKVSGSDEAGLQVFFQGIKDGMIKTSKGELISEQMTTVGNEKAFNFTFSFMLKKDKKVVENFIFFYKNATYTMQFMTGEKQSEKFKIVRKDIIESVTFN